MPHHPPCPSEPTDLQPAHADPAALRALLAAAAADPWRASLFMRRLTTLRERVGELRAWLADLPRHLRRAWARRWATALPAAALLLALTGGGATARMDAMIPVAAGVVVIAADGDCSLREAIINANDGAATHADCTAGDAGPDTIILPTGSTFTVPDVDNTTNGENGLPSITTEITIEGNGSTIERAPADPDTFRLFHVAVSGDLTLDETTVTGGVADDGFGSDIGGGIYSLGTLALLSNSTVSGNSAGTQGGGIYNRYAGVTLTNSTVSGNSAGMTGGGIDIRYASATLTNSTVSGNSAGTLGGGLYFRGSVTLTNSTVSGNSSSIRGGGIHVALGSSILTLINSTVSGNSTGVLGGGILTFAATVALTNTIIADQVAGADCGGNKLVTSGDFNLDSDGTCNLTQANDIPSGNANLGPLTLNPPGNTATHALVPGSDALDAGDCSGGTITIDQRGVSRPQDGNGDATALCDIGAFELTPATPPPTAAQVTGFRVDASLPGRVALTWETASEVDVAGFNVYRAGGGAGFGRWTRVNDALIPARGGASGGARYGLADAPGAGAYRYRLEVASTDGPPQTVGPVDVALRVLRAFLPWGRR